MQTTFRNIENFDTFTILLAVSVLVLVLAKFYNSTRFYTFLSLPFNNKYITFYSKKGRLKNGFHLLVSFFQLVNFSIFILLGLKTMGSHPVPGQISFFLVIAGGLFVFLAVKALLQLGAGFVFEIDHLVSELIFSKQSYYNHSGFVLFLANILLLYVFPGSIIVFYIALFSFLVINFIGWVNALRIHQNLFRSHVFYFILYLCALEISPLVIIGSYLKG